MHCPNCKDIDLSPVEVEKGLIGAGCAKCSGVLLSLIQYRYWADHFHPEESDTKPSGTVAVEDSKGAKFCPKCSKIMTKYRVDYETENRIELCSHCDEAWLDSGEWQLLKTLDVAQHLPEVFTNAWQKKIRAERQHAHWKKHYSETLGKDTFQKVDEFKQWLDSQPKASEIKHYLTTNFDI